MSDLHTLRDPARYHGARAKPPFFEGWYFKLVDASELHRYAIIPGVFIGREPGASHAFVQTLDGATGRTVYHRYPFEAFRAAPDAFDVRIGPNRFRVDRVELDIDREEGRMQGELRFSGLTPWPVTLTSPGVMGWYAYMPFMECYHGVLSFDHSITGQLAVSDATGGTSAVYDFTGGRGYIEKDWGQAFPRAWIWTQSNHFGADAPGTSLSASVAIIPWLRGAFPGFIVGLRHGGRLYRFATYTGAVIERLELTDSRVAWRMAGSISGVRHWLEIVAWRAEGGLLHSPERVAMLQRVLESLTARLDVRLVASEGGRERVIFEGVGSHAGLEIVGPIRDIQRLVQGKGR